MNGYCPSEHACLLTASSKMPQWISRIVSQNTKKARAGVWDRPDKGCDWVRSRKPLRCTFIRYSCKSECHARSGCSRRQRQTTRGTRELLPGCGTRLHKCRRKSAISHGEPQFIRYGCKSECRARSGCSRRQRQTNRATRELLPGCGTRLHKRRRKSAINHGDPTAVDCAPRSVRCVTVFTVDLRSKALVLV